MTTTVGQRQTGKDPEYLLSRGDVETRRLMLQARMYNAFTRAVLLRAGIAEGMRVLDAGSGPGAVTLLVADLVGPRGTVVGVDTDAAMLELARQRADASGLTNVAFVEGDCRSVALDGGFDAVVGRAILLYVSDPAETLRSLLNRVGPGGIVALQEFNLAPPTVQVHPALPLWQRLGEWATAAGRQAGLDLSAGYHLRRAFLDAGLPAPRMQLDSDVGGGPDWEGYEYFAATFRGMLPLLLKSGVATAEEVDIDTLAERLRTETVAAGAVVKAPDLVSAWARKP